MHFVAVCAGHFQSAPAPCAELLDVAQRDQKHGRRDANEH